MRQGMISGMTGALAMIAAALAMPVAAQETEGEGPAVRASAAHEIVERAIAAHGGDIWLRPETLALSGKAVFFNPETGQVRSTADDYRMWRSFDPERSSAHGASGKVRIIAKSGAATIFEVGYDGDITWTQQGIMPQAEADVYWANNFGFGIIRQALESGFTLSTAPTRILNGNPANMVRIRDPQGAQTLFGFDAESSFITYMAFDSPRGFHERLYADFVKLDNGWVQARRVTLLYDGIINNKVLWTQTEVGEPIAPEVFRPPAGPSGADVSD